MVTKELLDDIVERYTQGLSKDQMKLSLMAKGWEEVDIDLGIAQLQREALQQIPLVASIANYFSHLDHKTANISTKGVIAVLGGCGFFLLLIAAGLYLLLDPLGVEAAKRDDQREKDFIELRTALERYNQSKYMYPQKLEELSPSQMEKIPVDPRTKEPYEYELINNQLNYRLCVYFESAPIECVSSKVDSTVPLVDQSDVKQSDAVVVPPTVAAPKGEYKVP